MVIVRRVCACVCPRDKSRKRDCVNGIAPTFSSSGRAGAGTTSTLMNAVPISCDNCSACLLLCFVCGRWRLPMLVHVAARLAATTCRGWLEKISDKGLILKAVSLCVQGLHQRIVGLWPSAKSACKRDYARVQHRRPSPMLVHVAARLAATTCTVTRESTSSQADLGWQIRKPRPD